MRVFTVLPGAPRACMDFRDPTEVSRLKDKEQKKTNGAINVTVVFIFNQYYGGIKLGAIVKSGNTCTAI